MGKTRFPHGGVDQMVSKPKVSVVIATHNSAEHIGECLDSILSQASFDIEIIVVDVNSTDGTKEILSEAEKNENRVIFLADSMGSIGRAKNRGLDHATAPYIVFIEPDDVLYKDSLFYMSNELEGNPGIVMFACETDSFGDDSYGRTNNDKRTIMGDANERDKRTQQMESRTMRSFMFDDITMYRTAYLQEKDIRHYETPGHGRQDSAFRFLAMAKGISFGSVAVMSRRRMDVREKRINDIRVVKDICDEFKYLERKLKEDKKLWWQMRLIFWQAYYDRNMLLYEKLSDDLRSILSKRMQADIRGAIHRKEFGRDHFDVVVRDEMELLLRSADEFDRYQNDKIAKRERERDRAITKEKRQDEIFYAYEQEEIERASADADEELRRKKQNARIDRKWLMDEMARDLAPLRMLLGMSVEEMGSILGVSTSTYKGLESGKRKLSWDMYMALLFLFHYNDRTSPVVDGLGLYPEPLKLRMRKGVGIGF